MLRWSMRASTSAGQSRIRRLGWKVERPMPGRSMAIMWSGKGTRAQRAASRREVGKPWK
jgi:hypothetical protein